MFKPEDAWKLIKRNAEKAKITNTSWASPIKGARYSLKQILDNKIVLWREDKETEVSLTKSKVEQKALELIRVGGQIKIGELIAPTVAEETAFVFFHNQITWNGDFIVIIK